MHVDALICACAVIVGAVLFLHGANSFNAVIGWIGFSLVVIGFLAEMFFKVYKIEKKKS